MKARDFFMSLDEHEWNYSGVNFQRSIETVRLYGFVPTVENVLQVIKRHFPQETVDQSGCMTVKEQIADSLADGMFSIDLVCKGDFFNRSVVFLEM